MIPTKKIINPYKKRVLGIIKEYLILKDNRDL